MRTYLCLHSNILKNTIALTGSRKIVQSFLSLPLSLFLDFVTLQEVDWIHSISECKCLTWKHSGYCVLHIENKNVRPEYERHSKYDAIQWVYIWTQTLFHLQRVERKKVHFISFSLADVYNTCDLQFMSVLTSVTYLMYILSYYLLFLFLASSLEGHIQRAIEFGRFFFLTWTKFILCKLNFHFFCNVGFIVFREQ